MEDFQKAYIEKMGSRIEALISAGQGLQDDFFEAASSIRRLAHTLRGSGATYGFQEITDLATATEDANDASLKEALDALVSHLQSLYEDQRPEREKILVVDDSDEIRLMLDVILKAQGYAVTTAETAALGQECLKQDNFDLLILDLVLPDMDGRNFLIKLRENPTTALIPVLVLSAKNSPQIKAECFALGADDYFEKPLDPALLTTRVAVGLQRSRLMEKQTRRDILTGLPNRAAFTEAYDTLVARSPGESNPSCIAMLDLDHFKRINDEHGHMIGDEVLKHAADVLSLYLGSPNILARWGGEEFAALLPNSSNGEVKTVLGSALQHLLDKPYLTKSKTAISLSFSAGVYPLGEDLDLNEVLAKADQLLYQAKSSGRGCILTSDDELEVRPQKILLAEDDDLTSEFILHRLRKDGFEVDHFERGDQALEAGRKQKYVWLCSM